MKKLFLLTLLIGSAFLAQSQINPGTIYVGASSSGIYQSVKSGNSTVTLSNIAVKIGYFAAENLVIGGNIDYSEISSSSSFFKRILNYIGTFYPVLYSR